MSQPRTSLDVGEEVHGECLVGARGVRVQRGEGDSPRGVVDVEARSAPRGEGAAEASGRRPARVDDRGQGAVNRPVAGRGEGVGQRPVPHGGVRRDSCGVDELCDLALHRLGRRVVRVRRGGDRLGYRRGRKVDGRVVARPVAGRVPGDQRARAAVGHVEGVLGVVVLGGRAGWIGVDVCGVADDRRLVIVRRRDRRPDRDRHDVIQSLVGLGGGNVVGHRDAGPHHHGAGGQRRIHRHAKVRGAARVVGVSGIGRVAAVGDSGDGGGLDACRERVPHGRVRRAVRHGREVDAVANLLPLAHEDPVTVGRKDGTVRVGLGRRRRSRVIGRHAAVGRDRLDALDELHLRVDQDGRLFAQEVQDAIHVLLAILQKVLGLVEGGDAVAGGRPIDGCPDVSDERGAARDIPVGPSDDGDVAERPLQAPPGSVERRRSG